MHSSVSRRAEEQNNKDAQDKKAAQEQLLLENMNEIIPLTLKLKCLNFVLDNIKFIIINAI